jgi:hypothetical protein
MRKRLFAAALAAAGIGVAGRVAWPAPRTEVASACRWPEATGMEADDTLDVRAAGLITQGRLLLEALPPEEHDPRRALEADREALADALARDLGPLAELAEPAPAAWGLNGELWNVTLRVPGCRPVAVCYERDRGEHGWHRHAWFVHDRSFAYRVELPGGKALYATRLPVALAVAEREERAERERRPLPPGPPVPPLNLVPPFPPADGDPPAETPY